MSRENPAPNKAKASSRFSAAQTALCCTCVAPYAHAQTVCLASSAAKTQHSVCTAATYRTPAMHHPKPHTHISPSISSTKFHHRHPPSRPIPPIPPPPYQPHSTKRNPTQPTHPSQKTAKNHTTAETRTRDLQWSYKHAATVRLT
ncbi:uncharacterized protein K452DRAFT_117083 [Aplosporella prunicola CBS 121167]|uniref:Uncharacterized protein n=1 Tax=Aplosporella prunicola CBS 121167 TaxID=1176127 RepID=A0A6A6AXZ1_9PEZI|nr:uncharacterized protein K452DRAFT_117083 [Aplosporella prunicola CBS 121167]KAF2136809.1 hypothetical protein K452DRAFT_117083 [Aplosporella prunicola CBS 121167]